MTGTIGIRLGLPILEPRGVPVQRATIIATYPHDPGAFTQGLLWSGGRLFESTGEVGKSELREVRLSDGAMLRRAPFPAEVWGEGIADWDDEIIGLTLESGIALRWACVDFAARGTLPLSGAGWGLVRMHKALVISDGTPVLRIVDPKTFGVRRTLTVTEDGRPLPFLNDLAFVGGELLANIFMTDTIARIDPATGAVTARIDLSDIVAQSGRSSYRDVLNGIAWDEAEGRLFVTGKNWPRLYEIKIAPRP